MKRVKVGIIGCGKVAHMHAQPMHQIQTVNLLALIAM